MEFGTGLIKELWEEEGIKPALKIKTGMEFRITVAVWLKWLDYEPKFEKELMQALSSKNTSTLSLEELQILIKYQERTRISQLIKKYETDFDFDEYIETITYLEKNTIEELMFDKLSQEEKEYAKLEIERLCQLPDKELEKKIEEMKNEECTLSLSMIDFYVLYEISKIEFNRYMSKLHAAIRHRIANDKMLSREPQFHPLMQ